MRKTVCYFILSLIYIFSSFSLSAQKSENTLNNLLALNFTYANQWPAGDLKDRFGGNLEIGVGLDFVTKKQSFIFGITGQMQFGNEVKEDVLEIIRNEDGFIPGSDQAIAFINLRQRGLYLGAHFGKIFSLSSTNPRSGIRATFGVGLLSHKIRLQDDLQTVNLVKGDYRKGFDRLTNGLALSQFLGYQVFSKNRLVNLLLGVEFIEGFTQSRRSFDFATMMVDEQKRFDIIYGIKVGWILPFDLNADSEQIYY